MWCYRQWFNKSSLPSEWYRLIWTFKLFCPQVRFKIQIKYLIYKFYFCSSWSFGSRKIWQIMWYVVFRCYNVYFVSVMYYVRVITGSIPHDKYTFLDQLSYVRHFIIYITQILIERPLVLKDQTFFGKSGWSFKTDFTIQKCIWKNDSIRFHSYVLGNVCWNIDMWYLKQDNSHLTWGN